MHALYLYVYVCVYTIVICAIEVIELRYRVNGILRKVFIRVPIIYQLVIKLLILMISITFYVINSYTLPLFSNLFLYYQIYNVHSFHKIFLTSIFSYVFSQQYTEVPVKSVHICVYRQSHLFQERKMQDKIKVPQYDETVISHLLEVLGEKIRVTKSCPSLMQV